MSEWSKSDSSVADPLAQYAHKPMLAAAGKGAKYLGRVIIEVWETGNATDDSQRLTFSSEAVDGNHEALLTRVAAGLPKRVERRSQR
jgi:hypothetical protein